MIKQLVCKCGQVIIVPEDKHPKASNLPWRCSRGSVYYSYRGQDGKTQNTWLAEFVMGKSSLGEWDHKNGNGHDNSYDNLRPCTRSQNMANSGKRVNNTSGFKGVSWHPQAKKWRAYIKVNGRQISLGLFDLKEDAAKAYDKAAKKYFGEFAVLNFPDTENPRDDKQTKLHALLSQLTEEFDTPSTLEEFFNL